MYTILYKETIKKHLVKRDMHIVLLPYIVIHSIYSNTYIKITVNHLIYIFYYATGVTTYKL